MSKLIAASLALDISSSAILSSFLQLDLAEFEYSRNKIVDIGDPYGIPVSSSTFSWICPLKESCSFLLLRKVAAHYVNAIGSLSSL